MFNSLYWPIIKILGPGLVIIVIAKVMFDIVIPELAAKYRRDKKFKAGAKWRSDRDLLQWLRGMKPSEFEEYIATLFSKLGYKANAVGRSHDGGIDVEASKNGITNYIQCKKYITSQVPVGAVRDFYGALADRIANGKGYFITTNTFTLESETFAEGKPIELIDGNRLVEYIRIAEKNDFDVTPKITKTQQKNCPECSTGIMTEKRGRFGRFYGCSNYPKCRHTEHI